MNGNKVIEICKAHLDMLNVNFEQHACTYEEAVSSFEYEDILDHAHGCYLKGIFNKLNEHYKEVYVIVDPEISQLNMAYVGVKEDSTVECGKVDDETSQNCFAVMDIIAHLIMSVKLMGTKFPRDSFYSNPMIMLGECIAEDMLKVKKTVEAA